MNLRQIVRGIDQISLRVGHAVSWLTLALVLLTTVDVTMRYVFHTGAVFIQELEWHLFGLTFLLAGGYALQLDAHVRVDIFYAGMSPRAKACVDMAGSLLILLPVCVLVIWSSHKFVANSWGFLEGSPDPGGLPGRYLMKSMIPLGFVLLALQGVAEALRNYLKLAGREDAP
jgi:TRAP-type mannitol/chloroaromatic compound transport system permease small subunit